MACIVSDMFSATAAVAVVSVINLSNSFTNLTLSKLISRRNNPARLSVLENSAITRCRHKSFRKRPRKKKRFWIKPRRAFYTSVLLEGTRQFFHHPTSNVLNLTKPSWIDKNYACATRSSLPANRFHTETSGRFAFT